MSSEESQSVDLYPVAFVIIATYDDFKTHALNLMRSLPTTAQVCVLFNEQGPSSSLSEVDVKREGSRTLRSRKWIHKKGEFNFSEARNLAQELATKDWIFWIDTDEILAHAQHDGIAEAASNAGGGVGGFMAGQASLSNYERLIGDQNASYINTAQCRLYRNHCGFKWQGFAHEQIVPSIQAGGYSLIETTITVIHNGYSYDYDSLIQKLKRNTSLIGRWLHENDESHALHRFYRDLYIRDISGLTKMENIKCQ